MMSPYTALYTSCSKFEHAAILCHNLQRYDKHLMERQYPSLTWSRLISKPEIHVLGCAMNVTLGSNSLFSGICAAYTKSRTGLGILTRLWQ